MVCFLPISGTRHHSTQHLFLPVCPLHTLLQAAQLAEEYDLLAKGKQALGVVGEVADTAIAKTVELEKEYKVRPRRVSAATCFVVLAQKLNHSEWSLTCEVRGGLPCAWLLLL